VTRFDESGPALIQAMLTLEQDFGTDFTANATLAAYEDGDQHVGLTEAYINWKPLSAQKLKWQGKAGFFYPQFSAESVQSGWLSPYTFTPSAINTWLGEELRIAGAELTLFSPGRVRRSPWTDEGRVGVFGGNDPFGTLLSYRGFATHDRQSLQADRVEFAKYPNVTGPPIAGPSWVEPFHEIDQRLGWYAGYHLQYQNKLDVRLHRYDNNGDPTAFNSQRQYAWDTKFSSVAVKYQMGETTLLSQFIDGSTRMGSNLVAADYRASYLMLSHVWSRHRVSIRWEDWRVAGQQDYWLRNTDSDGTAYALAWRYDLSDHWQIGVEYLRNSNAALSRLTMAEPAEAAQQHWLVVVQYRFTQ